MTESATSQKGPRVFPVTQWTLVLAAGAKPSPESAQALERLCASYWYPLYAYVRRCGHGPADAEDLTQGYFARLLGLDSLAAVGREKGRFRSFLLAGMNHFLADQRDRATAQKRDVRRTVSFDSGSAETRYLREPVDTETPERLFERQWALALLEAVVGHLRDEQQAAGKGAVFMALRFAIGGDRHTQPYATLAEELGMSEAAVRVTVHRLRQRYRQLLRDEIARTVADEAEIDEELRHLRRILSG